MPRKLRKPAYTFHRPTGQARVRIQGKDHYLGPYGSPESREAYDALLSEWFCRHDASQVALTVNDLALLFLDHAAGYYRHRDGTPTRTTENIRIALRSLIARHGTTRIRDFGPRALKDVRQAMIAAGHCRSYINGMIGKIKRVFRWGVEEELVPPAVYQSLAAVSGLRAGRSAARESSPVLPVPEEVVNRTLPHLPHVVADMVRLQLLTGMRPGEVCALRPREVTRGMNGVWIYRPERHKTEHRGRERRIDIGPIGQAILGRYLGRDPDACCFSPAESEAERNTARKAIRRSPMTPSQAARRPKGRAHREHYTKDSYNRAVQRACEQAFGMPDELRYVDRTVRRLTDTTDAERSAVRERLNAEAGAWREKHCWSPNQLRHSRATAIRER